MKDPHKVLDYDNWWKKSLGNIKDYVIPALSDDIVKKLHVGLDASAERIWRTRPAEEAHNIVQLLRELIDSHKEEHAFKFSWSLSIYKTPPKKANKVAQYQIFIVNFTAFFVETNPIRKVQISIPLSG